MDHQDKVIEEMGRAVQVMVTKVSELTLHTQHHLPLHLPHHLHHQRALSSLDHISRSPRNMLAALWGMAVWENCDDCWSSFSNLSEEMKRVFDRSVAARPLSDLHQEERSVSDYAIEFRTLAAECKWNEQAQWDHFLNRLADASNGRLTSSTYLPLSMSVMEGDSVTIHTDITEIQTDDVIEWMFGVESPDKIIAEYNKEANTTSFDDERFKNHLYVNHQTGDLIITNITNKHTGLYKVEITRKTSVVIRHFNLTVNARLPVPVISSNSSQCSLSSRCVLLCSVLNVRDVSLSWYKGNSLLSIISVSDLNIRLSLHLEVEYQDTNTYRCVLNNTITKQTQHLNNIKNLCQMCSADVYCCCGFTEVVIQLVVSALVGVAAVAFLIYDIRSR
nr:uncharacterized protein LOC129453024 [Misgurnus anguillicaudatus]